MNYSIFHKHSLVLVSFILMGLTQCYSQDNDESLLILNKMVGTWTNSFISVLDSTRGHGVVSNELIINGRFLKMNGETIFHNDTTVGLTIIGYNNTNKRYTFFHIESTDNNVLTCEGDYDTLNSTITFVFKILKNGKDTKTQGKLILDWA